MKKSGVLLCLMVFTWPSVVHAEQFICELILNTIPNTESSEYKTMHFDAQFNTNRNSTHGTFITNACFGRYSDLFQSTQSQMNTLITGDVIAEPSATQRSPSKTFTIKLI